ncbi:MAG: hypothetical protein ACR2NU_13740 [Aeoliella sp.]
MKFSMLPVLFLVQLVAIYWATKTTQRSGRISAAQSRLVTAVLAMLVLWGFVTSGFSLSGWYHTDGFLKSLPGFWISMPPILIVMLPWMLSSSFRQATNSIIDCVPLHYVMAFEGLRITAIGGIIKGNRGDFSAFFGNWVGIPDFLFGTLSLAAAYLIFKGIWSKRSAIGINLFGFLVIVPYGLVLMHLGLPGIMHMIDETPDLTTIFNFPMVLALTLVVPIFIVINLLVAMRLLTHQESSGPS